MNSDFYTHMVTRQQTNELYERAAQNRLAQEAKRAAKQDLQRRREIEELQARVDGRKPRHGWWGRMLALFAADEPQAERDQDPVDRFLHSDRTGESEPAEPTAPTR